MIPERTPYSAVEKIHFGPHKIQDQMERGGSRANAPLLPVLWTVASKTPEFGSVRGDLEPRVADQEEVVGAFHQLGFEDGLGDDVPMGNWIQVGGSADVLSNEFRRLLRWIMVCSSRCSSICFSKARMDSMLVSQPILLSSCVRNYEKRKMGVLTSTGGFACESERRRWYETLIGASSSNFRGTRTSPIP